MNLENTLYFVSGIAAAATYANVISPLRKVSKQTGISIFKLDVEKTLDLHLRLDEWSYLIPTRDTSGILQYLRDKIGNDVVVKASPILNSKDAPFPSYWDKMFERSLLLKKKVSEIYKLPEVTEYLRA